MASTLTSWPSSRSSISNLVARLAKLFVFGDPFDRFDGGGAAVADEHAFAAGQAVGFDDDWNIFTIAQKRDRMGGIAENLVFRRGYVGMPQQVFAKDLAAFQLGGRFCGAEDAQLLGLESIDNAGHQRRFRAGDGQSDFVFLGELSGAGNR